jgi:hypothetical protein
VFHTPIGQAGFTELANIIKVGFGQIYNQIRYALPQSKIVFFNVAWGSNARYEQWKVNHRYLMLLTKQFVEGAGDNNLYWLPAAAWQNETPNWWIHPDGADLESEADAIGALISSL